MKPIVISTWKHGLDANEEAYKNLIAGANSLDSVERGLMVTENDPDVHSVGYGGLPDNEGRVTLDAALMDWKARIGSVIGVEHIKNPIKLARVILENTEHTILSGGGAFNFAIRNGFVPELLLTEYSLKKYNEWKSSEKMGAAEIHTDDYQIPEVKKYNDEHDTIGMIAMDSFGNLTSGCTTSGLAWKLHGRVGDSPIIGAGLYTDSEAGAAVSTGRGEECVRACGSFYTVELMRKGVSPKDACKKACERVYKLNLLSSKNRNHIYQVAFVAMNKDGETGAFSIREGFQYAVMEDNKNTLFNSDFLIDEKYIIEEL